VTGARNLTVIHDRCADRSRIVTLGSLAWNAKSRIARRGTREPRHPERRSRSEASCDRQQSPPRAGALYERGCFSEIGQGPIVALEPDDQRAILLHFEALAQSRDMETLSFQVPSINVVVMNHLLERGYKIDAPPGSLMSSRDFGRFDRFVLSRPPSCCDAAMTIDWRRTSWKMHAAGGCFEKLTGIARKPSDQL
jgi:hypothetical protein